MRFITFRSPGKPFLVKYLKWLLKVIKGQRVASRPDHKGYIEGHCALW